MSYRRLPFLAAILISFSLQAYAAAPATGSAPETGSGAAKPGPSSPPPANQQQNQQRRQQQQNEQLNQLLYEQQELSQPSAAVTVNLLPASVNGQFAYVNGGAFNSNGAAVTGINWDWGDGQQTYGFFPQIHAYASAGQYVIVATASWQDGNFSSASQAVNVGPGIVENCLQMKISAGTGGSVSYNAGIGATNIGAGTLSEGQSVILRFPPGAKVSGAETPNRGSVFSGWTDSAGITAGDAKAVSFATVVTAAESQIIAHFRVTPAIDSAKASVLAQSLALPPYSQLYVFGMGTSGAKTSSAFAAGQSVSVSNADEIVLSALAATTSNTNSYTSNCANSVIGAFGVSGFSHVQGFYDANSGPKADCASVKFSLAAPAMVVLLGVASGQQSLTFSGIDGLVTVVPPNQKVSLAMARANLKAGTYTVKQTSSASATARQDPNQMADLLGVFIFSNDSSPATSYDSSPIPIPSGKGYTSILP